jgi:hypothetical protein
MSEEDRNEPMRRQEQGEQKSGFSEEQYKLLKHGNPIGWNIWREKHSKEPILLQRADLGYVNLESGDFRNADLQEARLVNANLHAADLKDAKLQRADLFGANLQGAKLTQANLQEAELVGANLQRAGLTSADLRKADLSIAYLQEACLEGANLQGAKLRGAHLQQANLKRTSLQGTDLKEADLERADLSGSKGIVFDSTYILNTRHIPPNDWHRLRNRYTGIHMIFNLVFLALFVSMYGAKAMFWYGMGKGQDFAIERVQALEQLLAKRVNVEDGNGLTTEERQTLKQTLAVVSWISTKLKEEAAGRLQGAEQAAGARFRKLKVWQVLISYDKGGWFLAAAILLIVYNLLRYILTRRIASLSEEEARTHYTPALKEYKWLLWPHRVTWALGFLAVLSFAVHGYDWLTTDVFVPRQVDTGNRIDQQAPGALPPSPGPAGQSTDGKSASRRPLSEYLSLAANRTSPGIGRLASEHHVLPESHRF